jgi:hypothetical protein
MIPEFVLLAVAGGVLRLGLGLLVLQRSAFVFCVPQLLAAAVVVLAGLPDLLKPFPFPVPLGFALGFLLPDLLLARRS